MSGETLRLACWRSPEGQAEYVAAYEEALSLWPVPCESRSIATRFGTTHAVVSGPAHARPLVLLPAATGAGALQWFPNAARLCRHCRVYALDFVGAPGKGSQTQPILGAADFASWLTDLFDVLEIERANVVGSSQGGWMAISLAVHAVDRVGALVLLAPAASLLPFKKVMYWMLRRGPNMPAWTAKPSMKLNFGGRYTLDDRIVRVMAMALKHFRYQEDALIPHVFNDEELRRVTARTLILLGEKEFIYEPRAALVRAREFMPDVETELVPNTGHLLNMEQADLVDSRILDFLSRKGTDSRTCSNC